MGYMGWAAELVGIILSWMILPSPSNKPPESRNSELDPSFLPSLGLGGKEDPNFAPSIFFQVQGNCGHLSWQVRLGVHSFRRFVWGCFCWTLKLVEAVGRSGFPGLGFVPGQEVRINGDRINGVRTNFFNGVLLGWKNPLILTFDPNLLGHPSLSIGKGGPLFLRNPNMGKMIYRPFTSGWSVGPHPGDLGSGNAVPQNARNTIHY